MRNHLIDFEVIYANNPKFPADPKLYGREGVVFRFEFSKNEYFTNSNLGKACGKKKDENNESITHANGMPIDWVSNEKKLELMGAGLDETESLGGESLDVKEDDDSGVEMNDEGLDKFSQALTDDLWADPMVWYTCENDSDDSDSSDEDFEINSEDEDM